MKILFLDLDGVANGHERHANGYCGTKPECVAQLNRVIAATDCKLVISSAWRYLVVNESMTLLGLENLLLTHGLDCKGRVAGLTREDRSLSDKHERGKQVREWINSYLSFNLRLDRYAVVDDDDELGIPEAGHPFVKTDGKVGLTEADADKLIALLGRIERRDVGIAPGQGSTPGMGEGRMGDGD